MRVHDRIEVTDNEILPRRKVVAQQIRHYVIHGLRVKDPADHRHHQHDERKEREQGIGGDRKRKRVNLGLRQVLYRREDGSGMLLTATLHCVGDRAGPNCDLIWSDFKHRVPLSYQSIFCLALTRSSTCKWYSGKEKPENDPGSYQ